MRFSNEFYDTKKRSRKLSDEVYALVDVGNDAPNAPPLDQCVETEVSVFQKPILHVPTT